MGTAGRKRFLRDLGAALEGLRDIPAVGKLCAALDRLQSEAGDSWSAALAHPDCSLLSLDALQSAEARDTDGQSRTVTLMLTLGSLYEQLHELSSSSLGSLSGVCEHLLRPFAWLEAALLNLVGKHKLSALPKVAQVLKDREVSAKYKTAAPVETLDRLYDSVPMAERQYDVFINHCKGLRSGPMRKPR